MLKAASSQCERRRRGKGSSCICYLGHPEILGSCKLTLLLQVLLLVDNFSRGAQWEQGEKNVFVASTYCRADRSVCSEVRWCKAMAILRRCSFLPCWVPSGQVWELVRSAHQKERKANPRKGLSCDSANWDRPRSGSQHDAHGASTTPSHVSVDTSPQPSTLVM